MAVPAALSFSLALSLNLGAVLVPQDAGVVAFTRVTINNRPDDQYDPHVDDDLAAYSDATPSQIRYYRFSTRVDQPIPNVAADGTQAVDLLSDVSQGRVVFTRVLPDRNAIMLFDATTGGLTEVAPSPGSNRQGVALGAQTVAFADFGVEANGEIYAVDLGTGAATRLTTDTAVDRLPSVSADGAVIAWEHCVTTCAVWKAVHGATGWAVSPVSTGTSGDTNPDSSNAAIAYESIRAGSATGPDLFLAPLAGGAEQQLALAGDEYNPSLRGDVLAFEHREPGASFADLYVYQLSTNRLFQITDTPTIAESLNDVTILADGSVRVVWEARDDGTTRNIYGATFTLPAVVTPPPPPPPPPGCQARTASLVASRFYSPTHWADGVASFSPPFNFALPATLPVTAGSPGNQWATLTVTNGSRTLECAYRGAGARYTLYACSGGARAGSIVAAQGVKVRVQAGDSHRGPTQVTVALAEVCGGAAWPSSHHEHEHDDDDSEDEEGPHAER
jgi:hypothetical protein